MSHAIVNQIRRLPIKNPAKAVLWVIADFADDNGFAYPSHSTLALECGVNERTVMRSIAALEECGVLVANRTNGRHTTYKITPENYRLTVTPDTESPLTHSHHTPDSQSPHPCQRVTAPLTESHTIHQDPSYIPHISPSVNAREETSEPAPQKPKAEKTGVTIARMIESLPELSESVARDFIAYRKAKKAPLTETAWDRMAVEITKAAAHGYTPDDALAEAMVANWQSVKADWLINRNKPKAQHNQPSWQQEQNDKWGAFLGTAGQSHPKTVSPDNVIPFAVLEVRHG